MVLAQGAAAQVISPENSQSGVTPTPGESYSRRVAEFEGAQQKLLQGAETIVFSQDRGTADVIRSYPFLSRSMKDINGVANSTLARIASSAGKGTGVNILFVYKRGPLLPDPWCGADGCSLDVYVDDGTGYKKALGAPYTGSGVHVLRADGQVALFIEITRTSYRTGGQRELVLKGNSFEEKTRPFPPDCCGRRVSGPSPSAHDDPTSAKLAVGAQRTFGLNLLRGIVDHSPGKNVFISPLSVFLALQMAENGSAGATRTAMMKALALPDLEAGVLNASAAALQHLLKSPDAGALSIANALWADRHFTLAPGFVELCESVFGARAAALNFSDLKAAAEINDWVKTHTNGKIDRIVTRGDVANSAVILTNAVYFAANWRSPFPIPLTTDETFHKTGGATKTIAMMHQPLLTGAYRSGGNFEGAMLYCRQSSVFFYALLPLPGITPKAVLASLPTDRLTDGPADVDLDLKLPRFSLDFSASLSEYLKRMGMEVAFQPGADFGPMGSKQFFISDVIHKTRLEVDEKGTVAAAATAVRHGPSGAPSRQPRPKRTLVFDRPFVVLIGDSKTGALLFAGVIEDPPPAPPPATAPAEAPPPPPEPADLEGQTIEQVVAAMGQPLKKAKVGTKDIYWYKDWKVTFVNGKAKDVQ